MPILRRFYSIYRRTPIMDKRNKTALAYLLIGVAAAGRALARPFRRLISTILTKKDRSAFFLFIFVH
mgnify:CR=1 FL=1